MAVLRVGLTGGIGAGKSLVARIFRVLGVPVFDADSAAKAIMVEEEPVRQKIIERFGRGAYLPDGNLNRAALASAFAQPAALEALNAIVHPATIAAAQHWFNACTAPYAIKEAALFFESNSHLDVDFMVGVSAPENLRITRTMVRNGISREAVLARMARQMDETEKMARCNAVLMNNEIEPLLPQVLALHDRLQELARGGMAGV